VLPSGTVIDTGAADADAKLRATEPGLYEGLATLRDRVRGNAESVRIIERQFSMKNTMGYGLNSFVDQTRPVDILTHLIIGSEGTLAFVASAVLRTVPLLRHAMTGLLVFDDLSRATGSLPALVSTGPATIELLDATSLRVAQSDPACDEIIRRITVDRHSALLVEYQADSAEAVADMAAQAGAVLRAIPVAGPAELTADPRARARLWHTRKGLYTTVAEARPSGTTALLEDIVVPVPSLLNTCEQLIELFGKHGYTDNVIFGHAKDGNIHFMLTEQLGAGGDLQRFAEFTEDMVDVVLANGGNLKAEHGTGRIMAPFVRRQYGDELYDVTLQIKQLVDPAGLLNPGVIITDDDQAHMRDLKVTPTVEEEVDRCVECGYCEPVCPSRDLTTTPRQRIVLRREMQRAREAGDTALLDELESDYVYDGVQTCAVDGMCSTACPVLINTGDLVRRLRAETIGRTAAKGWSFAAEHWATTTRIAGATLTVADKTPSVLIAGPNQLARKVVDPDLLPLYSAELPGGGRQRRTGPPNGSAAGAEIVFFSACVGTMFGPAQDGPGARESFERLCARAGVSISYPDDLPNLCCGTPWKSKGIKDGYQTMVRKVLPRLWAASRHGELPVVCDASSCTEGLRHMLSGELAAGHFAGLRIVDATAFVAEHVLPKLDVKRRKASMALHPTCSSTQLGLNDQLTSVAAAVAESVTVPAAWGCCAFAGDRGMLHPELTASATEGEAAELKDVEATRGFDSYASCNRTCELGLTRATGHEYQHVLEVVDWATAP
jgi:D-lactate dehydrogenase